MPTEIQEQPIWFGGDGAQMFGWLSIPSTRSARAGLLLFPPVARELSATGPAYRRVASAAAARGFLVLRFAYHGTGDSGGSWPEQNCLDLWTDDLWTGVQLLESMGCRSLVAVGVRSGSLLLAEVLRRRRALFDLAVLWDPYPNGRAFLRAETLAFRFAGVAADTSGGHIEVPGYRISAPAAGEIAGLELAPLPEAATARLAVIERKDRRLAGSILAALGNKAETLSVSGGIEPGEVLSARAGVLLPGEPDLLAWIDGAAGAERRAISLPPEYPSTVLFRPSGVLLQEETLSLGPERLFAIATTATGRSPRAAVVLISVADEDHIGPFGLWVTLARNLAEQGFAVARCDLSGIGDSPTRPGGVPHAINADYAVDDVADIVDAFRPGMPTVLVGLCSGADVTVNAALNGTLADDLVLINPGYQRLRGASPGAPEPSNGVARRLKCWSLLRAARERFPRTTFRLLDRLGIERSPLRELLALRGRSTRTHLLLGDPDTRWNDEHGGWILEDLVRTGTIELRHVAGLDHAGAGSVGRTALLAAIMDLLERCYPDAHPPTAPPTEIVGARAGSSSVM